MTSGLSSANTTISTLQGTTAGLTTQLTAINAVLTPLSDTVNRPSGRVHDVAGLCGMSVLGMSLAQACV